MAILTTGRDKLWQHGVSVASDLTRRQTETLARVRRQGKRAYYKAGRLHVEGDGGNRDGYEADDRDGNHHDYNDRGVGRGDDDYNSKDDCLFRGSNDDGRQSNYRDDERGDKHDSPPTNLQQPPPNPTPSATPYSNPNSTPTKESASESQPSPSYAEVTAHNCDKTTPAARETGRPYSFRHRRGTTGQQRGSATARGRRGYSS